MVEIIEGRISAEMKDATRLSIIHAGSTKKYVHFFAIFACYIKKVGTYSSSGVIEEPHIVLLAFLPMHQIEAYYGDNNDSAADDDDEVVGFCVEVKHLSTTKA